MNSPADEAPPLQQIHKPSRANAIAFFIFSLAAAAFVIAWVFFLNKGTLAMEGETPFRMNVGGKEKSCDQSPCVVKLSPRKYRVTLQKEGYYEDAQEIEVKRWKVTNVSANFTFIPVVAEVKTRPPFSEEKKDDDFIYLQETNNKHALKMRKGNATVVTFERPFKNPQLSAAPTREKVLIADENNGVFSYYLVDIAKKSRRRLEMESSPADVKWVGPYIIFAVGENKKVFALHAETGDKTALSAIDAENVIEREPGVLVFFSTEQNSLSGEKLKTTISEALEIAKQEAASGQLPHTLFLTEFHMESGVARTLASIPAEDGKTPKKLLFNPDEKKIYFEMGNKFFEVILAK